MKPNTQEFVNLGDEVKDEITGFTGIVTAVTSFIHSCRRVQITPKVSTDGVYRDAEWLDEPQLTITCKGAYLSPVPKNSVTGGDRPDTPNR